LGSREDRTESSEIVEPRLRGEREKNLGNRYWWRLFAIVVILARHEGRRRLCLSESRLLIRENVWLFKFLPAGRQCQVVSGGGRSLARTPLSYAFPANREKYREISDFGPPSLLFEGESGRHYSNLGVEFPGKITGK
jgi:hypothetical protein